MSVRKTVGLVCNVIPAHTQKHLQYGGYPSNVYLIRREMCILKGVLVRVTILKTSCVKLLFTSIFSSFRQIVRTIRQEPCPLVVSAIKINIDRR